MVRGKSEASTAEVTAAVVFYCLCSGGMLLVRCAPGRRKRRRSPPFCLGSGRAMLTGLLIGEMIGWNAVAALAIILLGVWLARKRPGEAAG